MAASEYAAPIGVARQTGVWSIPDTGMRAARSVLERHRNNIGLIRLILASLVIIGHAPEMIDGDQHREPLKVLFDTVTLGSVAVDGFFLLSGYLITMSWDRTKSIRRYMTARLLRIYPAFVAAYLISVFGLGPLVGARPWLNVRETVTDLLLLQPPPYFPGELKGLHYPLLNGAMWTIAYEFRCYLAVVLLGSAAILNRRWLILVVTAAALVLFGATSFHAVSSPIEAYVHGHLRLASLVTNPAQPLAFIRLTATFMVGMCAYLFRDSVLTRMTGAIAAVCAAVTCILLFHDTRFAELALVTIGAAPLFWLGFNANLGRLQRINDLWDISYGVYLYGWPLATTILYFSRTRSPAALGVEALTLACAAGAASWWGLEKWAKNLRVGLPHQNGVQQR